MKLTHIANPVSVAALEIVSIASAPGPDGSYVVALRGGSNSYVSAEMVSRYLPVAGDYVVTQADGYTYVNPRSVFERKYSRIAPPPQSDQCAMVADYYFPDKALDDQRQALDAHRAFLSGDEAADQVASSAQFKNGERLVSMVNFQDRILIATEYHVYEYRDGVLVELKFKTAA